MLDITNLVGFDTETTGVEVYDPEVRVVSCSVILDENGVSKPLPEWILNPGNEVPEGAASVHGMTTEFVRANGADYFTGMMEIANVLAFAIKNRIPLVAYNGSFDYSLLRIEFDRIGIGFDPAIWDDMILIDPLIMDNELDPYRKGGRKLGTVAKLYGYDLENAHNAEADVLAVIEIAKQIVPKFIKHMEGKFGQEVSSFEDLMIIQSALYRSQKTRLEGYFRKSKGSDFTINKSWPMIDPDMD